MKTENATPRPWRINKLSGNAVIEYVDEYALWAERTRNDFSYATKLADCGIDGIAKNTANAELIIRSVNNHEALLEACKLGLTALKQKYEGDDYGQREYVQVVEKAIQQATV